MTGSRSFGRTWAAWLAALLLVVAGTMVGSDAVAQGAPVDQATPQQKAQARVHFAKAKKAFAAEKYEDALTALRASYAIVASPNSRIMIVQVLDAMGRSAEAYGEASAVMAEAEAAAAANPKYAKTADAARQLRDSIRPSVGMLTVQVPPDMTGAVVINGVDFPREYWNQPVPVMPGTLSVQLDQQPAKEVSIEGGGEATVDLAPPPPPPPLPAAPPPPPGDGDEEDDDSLGMKGALGIVAASVGLAGILNFSLFGSMTNAAYTNAELLCPTKTNCSPIIETELDAGRTWQAAANVSLVVGLVGLVGGAGLIVWDIVEPEEPDGADQVREDQSEFAIIRPRIIAGPGSLGIRGSF